MNFLYKRKVADCISSQSWRHPLCENLELPKVLSQFDLGDIIHDVQ